MLIAFLGAPQSGKTTVAMGLAYHLKLLGYPIEYLPENIRHHLTELRHQGLSTDHIMPAEKLYEAEFTRQKMYKETLPDSIIVADVICNTSELYGLKPDAEKVAEDLKMYDILFFCPLPSDLYSRDLKEDVKRIHGITELAEIQKNAYGLVKKYNLVGKMTVLDQQTAQQRVAYAVDQVLAALEDNEQARIMPALISEKF